MHLPFFNFSMKSYLSELPIDGRKCTQPTQDTGAVIVEALPSKLLMMPVLCLLQRRLEPCCSGLANRSCLSRFTDLQLHLPQALQGIKIAGAPSSTHKLSIPSVALQ